MSSDIIGCQDVDTCKDLLEYLDQELLFNDAIERLHRFLPGAKPLIPYNYLQDINAAMLFIPTTASSRFLFNVCEGRKDGKSDFEVNLIHPEGKYESYGYAPTLNFAIILASIEAHITSATA
jgi:hypothetical protein